MDKEHTGTIKASDNKQHQGSDQTYTLLQLRRPAANSPPFQKA